MRVLGNLAWLVLVVIAILCACPGGDMDIAFIFTH